MPNLTKEWNIPVPWGHIALSSWGDPSLQPVLLVHGNQDSVATFIPLLELLPDKYYYVGLDLPGHGRSSHFPPGIPLYRLHMVPVITYTVQHLGWTSFVYMGHSLGTELGKYYNALYPGQINKVIDLDPAPSMYKIRLHWLPWWYNYFYEHFYSNYQRYNGAPWPYTREAAVRAVERARGVTEDQAELVLSRNLVPVGDDKYALAWDPRLKRLPTLNTPAVYYLSLVSRCPVPTLVLWATDSMAADDKAEAVRKMLYTMQERLPDFSIVMVEGGHDVHLTHPQRLAAHVCDFLNKQFTKAKL